MSITDRPDPDIPFAPKRPRLIRTATAGDVVFEPVTADPVADDIVEELRKIAGAQGFALVPIAEAPSDPTDVHYVANSLDRLRYLDLKQVAKDMLGDAKPGTPAEFADLMAEWAAANKTKVPA